MEGKLRAPIRLKPVYLKSIWAGERLSKIRGLREPGIGISREVCTYRDSVNSVLGGPWDGRSLTELIKCCRNEVMGNSRGSQLVRVAFMDTAGDLSVQVHPV